MVETSDLLLPLSTKSRSELIEVWRFRAFHHTFDLQPMRYDDDDDVVQEV